MKFSQLLIPTTKEAPKDAVLKSHIFLTRAGFINQIGSGIYNFLPLGKIVLDKITAIIKKRMDEAGAQHISMGFVTPAQLWKDSGRFEKYGKELLRFKDRKDNEFVLGPTHEEVVTEIAKNFIKSYKQLPLNLYQINLKFRDEVRPRFGLMRGREFIMKDAYSFHSTEEDLDREFLNMKDTYEKICLDLGLDFRVVDADSGAIGGSGSKEFMVLADSGEDTLAMCKNCDYAANLEAAKRARRVAPGVPPKAEFNLFSTPNIKTIEDLCKFFSIDPFWTIKAVVKKIIIELDSGLVEDFAVFFIRGDDILEDTKALNALVKNGFKAIDIMDANAQEVINLGLIPGFIGAYGIRSFIGDRAVIFDIDLLDSSDLMCGGNQKDKHFVGVDLSLFSNVIYEDLCVVRENDKCQKCGGDLVHTKGIEVGHIFKLGTRYSSALNATFLDENGKAKPFIMGCYGIGVTRLMPAILEQKADEKGCVWSKNSAPFAVQIIISNIKDSNQLDYATRIYTSLLEQGIQVLLDERDLRFGAKIADFELIGSLLCLVVGKGLESNKVELIKRDGLEKIELDSALALESILNTLKDL